MALVNMATPTAKPAYSMMKRLGTARLREYSLIKEFNTGYRNREDITTLPPGIMVQGSQNVLTNTFQRVGIRKGYSLDGQRDTSTAPISAAYDWNRHTGGDQHLRAGFNTTGSNGILQFRYVAAAGDVYKTNTFTNDQVYWIDLKLGLTDPIVNFCEFWDFDGELKSLLLFVNKKNEINMWSGGVATIASTTAATITKNGSETWAQIGFLSDGIYTQQVLINGTTYTYTGGAGTTTLTGVTPSPAGEPNESVAAQAVVVFPNAGIAGLPANFRNTLIQNLDNQIYIAADDDQSVYVSKVNTFQDFTFASPRLVGQGAILTLDGIPNALVAQNEDMFISAGKDYWYRTNFVLSSDNKAESLTILRLKTTALQATRTQSLTSKIKNNIVYVSFETIVNVFGTQQNFLLDPQVQDISFEIVNDMDSYDFTDGSIAFLKKFIYISIPREGVVRIYNMTNESNAYWEVPQMIPIAQFSTIDGELYGHSYQSSNTFKLFSGYNDDGHTMEAIVKFSFDNLGIRDIRKSSNACFVEGYISSNTKITLGLQRDLNGSLAEFVISGSDSKIVQAPADDSSLGKNSLGKVSLGGSNNITSPSSTPPKFRVIKTYNRVPYFEEQMSFTSLGVDQRWELVAAGTNASPTSEEPSDIKE